MHNLWGKLTMVKPFTIRQNKNKYYVKSVGGTHIGGSIIVLL